MKHKAKYLGAMGSSGPLYLKTTEDSYVFKVINGDWLLDTKDTNNRIIKLILPSMSEQHYTTACQIIEETYDSTKYYQKLHGHTKYDGLTKNYTQSLSQHLIKQEIIMNQQNITVKTVHTVNDQDITTLSNDELLNYVVTIEQNIEKLKAIKEASSYVVREIEKQTKVLKTIVAHLDNRK